MKSRIAIGVILVLVGIVNHATAGLSIYVRSQVTPQYVSVNGPNGKVSRLNPGQRFTYPQSFTRLICQSPGFSIYSSSTARRSEVWEDVNGSATSAELFAACPHIREVKGKELRAEGAKRLSQIATPYMALERETWPIQMREAESYLFDPMNAETPMLTKIAQNRGVAIEELVSKVWDNVLLFRQASGDILGLQQRLLDQVDAEGDFARLLTIKWE